MSLFLEGKLVLEVNDPRRYHCKGLRVLNLGTRRFPVCICLIRDFFVSLEMLKFPRSWELEPLAFRWQQPLGSGSCPCFFRTHWCRKGSSISTQLSDCTMTPYQRKKGTDLLVRTRHLRISNRVQHVTPTTEVFVTNRIPNWTFRSSCFCFVRETLNNLIWELSILYFGIWHLEIK